MIKKEKTCLIIYFSMIVVCSLVHVSIFQNTLFIMASFILNLVMVYKLNIKSSKYEYISLGIILGVSLLVYLFFDKLNIIKIVLYSIVLILIILIVGKVMQFWGYVFLGLELLQSGDIEQI